MRLTWKCSWFVTRAARGVAALLGCALVLVFARRALAHEPFQITTEARVLEQRTELHVVLVRNTAAVICPDARLRELTSEEGFAAVRAEVERCGASLYDIDADGRRLRASEAHALLLDEDEIDLRLVYPPARARRVSFDARFLQRFSDPTYGATLTVTGDGMFLGQELLRADAPRLTVTLPSNDARARGGDPPAQLTAGFAQFLRLGVVHILTGYDHLLFLLGLLAACRRVKSVLAIVSCFTLAHSLTLGLAALGVVAPSSRLIEPLIALTIVFVGVENLLRGEDPRGRWAVALFFGLIHGFGFAGALREIGLGAHGAPIVAPLLAFNLGVELGQALVASLALPLLWQLRKVPWFARHGTQSLSAVTAGVGLFWLIERLL